MRDPKKPTRPLPIVAMAEVDTDAAPPIEALVDALLVKAHRAGASFVSVEHAVVRFLIANEWHVEQEVEPMLGPHIVRRLGVMIGVLPPKADEFAAGRLALRLGNDLLGFLIRIEREDGELTALVELVPHGELATRSSPRIPSTHPFR
jgi:hypothetical protein